MTCQHTGGHTKLLVCALTLKEMSISLQSSNFCRGKHPPSGLKTSLLVLRNKVYLLRKERKITLTDSDRLIRATDT